MDDNLTTLDTLNNTSHDLRVVNNSDISASGYIGRVDGLTVKDEDFKDAIDTEKQLTGEHERESLVTSFASENWISEPIEFNKEKQRGTFSCATTTVQKKENTNVDKRGFREVYTNRGRRWTSEQENFLRDKYVNDVQDINVLSQLTGRSPLAIACRLVMMGIIGSVSDARGFTGNVPERLRGLGYGPNKPTMDLCKHDPPTVHKKENQYQVRVLSRAIERAKALLIGAGVSFGELTLEDGMCFYFYCDDVIHTRLVNDGLVLTLDNDDIGY